MMGHMPGEGFLASLEKRLERVAWNFTPSEIANVLWAYATLGVMPSAGVVGLLEGQLRAVAGQLNHQDIFMTLWAACFLSIGSPDVACKLARALGQRALALAEMPQYKKEDLAQMHQFIVACSLDLTLRASVPSSVLELQGRMAPSCRAAFAECDVTESRTQQQVSDTLRSMGMAVEDEYICPLSGYSIDMLVRDVDASEQRRTGQAQKGWAVEFDGPHHFLSNKSPNGATLIKQRHLQLLGYALVNVAYWEWNGLRPGQREDYLRRRLQIEPGTIGGNMGREASSEGHADAIGSADIVHSITSGEDASDESEEEAGAVVLPPAEEVRPEGEKVTEAISKQELQTEETQEMDAEIARLKATLAAAEVAKLKAELAAAEEARRSACQQLEEREREREEQEEQSRRRKEEERKEMERRKEEERREMERRKEEERQQLERKREEEKQQLERRKQEERKEMERRKEEERKEMERRKEEERREMERRKEEERQQLERRKEEERKRLEKREEEERQLLERRKEEERRQMEALRVEREREAAERAEQEKEAARLLALKREAEEAAAKAAEERRQMEATRAARKRELAAEREAEAARLRATKKKEEEARAAKKKEEDKKKKAKRGQAVTQRETAKPKRGKAGRADRGRSEFWQVLWEFVTWSVAALALFVLVYVLSQYRQMRAKMPKQAPNGHKMPMFWCLVGHQKREDMLQVMPRVDDGPEWSHEEKKELAPIMVPCGPFQFAWSVLFPPSAPDPGRTPTFWFWSQIGWYQKNDGMLYPLKHPCGVPTVVPNSKRPSAHSVLRRASDVHTLLRNLTLLSCSGCGASGRVS